MNKPKGKHTKQRKYLQIMFIIIFVISVSYSIYYFYNAKREKKEYRELLNNVEIDKSKITNEKTERMLQIEELKKRK